MSGHQDGARARSVLDPSSPTGEGLGAPQRREIGPYLLDGAPVSARDLITAARRLDPAFGNDGLFFTSEAAQILREHGHAVEDAQP
jgi:hypothetical protein